jgi:hypothetical protein
MNAAAIMLRVGWGIWVRFCDGIRMGRETLSFVNVFERAITACMALLGSIVSKDGHMKRAWWKTSDTGWKWIALGSV